MESVSRKSVQDLAGQYRGYRSAMPPRRRIVLHGPCWLPDLSIPADTFSCLWWRIPDPSCAQISMLDFLDVL